jgi:hypothetical protein
MAFTEIFDIEICYRKYSSRYQKDRIWYSIFTKKISVASLVVYLENKSLLKSVDLQNTAHG